MQYTAEQIKAIGGKRFFKKNTKRIIILTAMSLIWVGVVNWLVQSPRVWIQAAPFGLVVFNVIWGYIQSRNLFYKRVLQDPTLLER